MFEVDIVIVVENIQYCCVVIYGVVFYCQGFLLWFIVVQDEEQIVVIVFVEIISGVVFYGQVIGRDYDDCVFEIG